MTELPFALALSAGMLAAVNPCGFALLPAYLSFLVLDDSPDRGTAVRRALTWSGAMTLGFVGVFGLFGLALAPLALTVQRHLPWVTIVLGVLLVVVGAWLVAGRSLPVPRLGGRTAKVRGSVPSMAIFGAGYALASLSCTVGPFLAIVVASFRTESVLGGATLFLGYAAGMGLVVGLAAVSVALARRSVVQVLRRSGAIVNRVGGGLMLIAGAYVAYYGWYELRLAENPRLSDPIIGGARSVQGWLAHTVDAAGAAWVAGLLAVLAAVGVLTSVRRRTARTAAYRESRTSEQPTAPGNDDRHTTT